MSSRPAKNVRFSRITAAESFADGGQVRRIGRIGQQRQQPGEVEGLQWDSSRKVDGLLLSNNW
jgi:hypothetical protein